MLLLVLGFLKGFPHDVYLCNKSFWIDIYNNLAVRTLLVQEILDYLYTFLDM